MLKLISYPAAFGQASASPFCVKAMCLLNMAGLEWQPEFTADPRKAPKQKLPVLMDGANVIPDSEAIRNYLEKKTGVDFDAGLRDEQRAISRAIIRMVEEHLYFAIVCDRWLVDANWLQVKAAFFGNIPAPIRGFVTNQIRKQARAQVMAQGMARHSSEEQANRTDADITAVSVILGDQPFLFGAKPTAADASVAAMLGALSGAPTKTALSQRVAQDKKLVAYCKRCENSMLSK